MHTRMTRARLLTGLTAAVTAVTLALGASPASASASSGYINGGGTWSDDFGDEGLLSTSSHSKSNATCLWQMILWAEGANEQNGTDYDFSDIDGVFGSNTKHATKRLQVTWGLADSFNAADGKVGTNTFGRADSKLRYKSGSTASGKYLRVKYDGAVHDLDFLRATNGRYIIYTTNGTQSGGGPVYASYTNNSCD